MRLLWLPALLFSSKILRPSSVQVKFCFADIVRSLHLEPTMGTGRNVLHHDDDVRPLQMSDCSLADRCSFAAVAEVITVTAEGSPIAALIEGSFAVSFIKRIAVLRRGFASFRSQKNAAFVATMLDSKKSKGPPQTKCCPNFRWALCRFGPRNLLCTSQDAS